MCGRYTLYEIEDLPERFGVEPATAKNALADAKKRYNIGPSQYEPVVVQSAGGRDLDVMQWGFMPRWARDSKAVFKYKTFNTRSEGVFDKPTWKYAIRHNRCLVPANGFYEWRSTPTGKQPFLIRPRDEPLFAFAGICGDWQDADGNIHRTYSILTTEPNAEMAAIHNRMPVILHRDEETAWLDPANDEPQSISQLLQPYPDGHLEVYEVSRDVNTTRVDDEHLVAPLNSR